MSVQDVIKAQVAGNPVVLYMKGTPQAPQCGFSQTAIQLADDPPALRQRRVRRRFGHPARDVPVGRTAEVAGAGCRQAIRLVARSGWRKKAPHQTGLFLCPKANATNVLA